MSNRKWYNEDGSRMICQTSECANYVFTMGRCRTHYNRKWMDEANRPVCGYPGCDKKARGKVWCANHYQHARRGNDMTGSDTVCPTPDCGRIKARKSEICKRCNQFRWRYGLTVARLMELSGDKRCSNEGCGSTTRVYLDHDHGCCAPGSFERATKVSCGDCVRGWLCQGCNTALGFMKEDPRRIEGLLSYLGRF